MKSNIEMPQKCRLKSTSLRLLSPPAVTVALSLLLFACEGERMQAQQRARGEAGSTSRSGQIATERAEGERAEEKKTEGKKTGGERAAEGKAAAAATKKWYSNVDVARQVLKKFEELQSYTARFQIKLRDGPRRRQMTGKLYYQKPGRLRYEFNKPVGNLIVSDGKIMWFYVHSLKAVGKQNLRLDKKNVDGKSIFSNNPATGLRRLFQKYHYRFDSPEQPRKEHKRLSFVFDMEQREKIGSYERMRIFVDAGSYLVYRAEAEDNYGKSAEIQFSDIKLDDPLEGKLFQYRPQSGVRVVHNPLVDEEGR